MNPTDPLPLAGRIAVIIGGAGGIGAACAKRAADAGAQVVLQHRSQPEKAEAVIASLFGTNHRAFCFDITHSNAFAALAAELESSSGVCLLVNGAGFTRAIPHADLGAVDDAFIDEMFAVHWRGAFAAVRALAPHLRRGCGLVANISSIAATTGIGSNIVYCAVKAATDSMTQTLARVLAPEARVVSIAPGLVDTEFVPGRTRDWRIEQGLQTPLRRLATADDVANAVVAAAVHLPLTTGSVIQVDCGRHL